MRREYDPSMIGDEGETRYGGTELTVDHITGSDDVVRQPGGARAPDVDPCVARREARGVHGAVDAGAQGDEALETRGRS